MSPRSLMMSTVPVGFRPMRTCVKSGDVQGQMLETARRWDEEAATAWPVVSCASCSWEAHVSQPHLTCSGARAAFEVRTGWSAACVSQGSQRLWAFTSEFSQLLPLCEQPWLEPERARAQLHVYCPPHRDSRCLLLLPHPVPTLSLSTLSHGSMHVPSYRSAHHFPKTIASPRNQQSAATGSHCCRSWRGRERGRLRTAPGPSGCQRNTSTF